MPSLPCFKMNAFWASENFEAFMVTAPPSPESTRKTLPKNDPVWRPQIHSVWGPSTRGGVDADYLMVPISAKRQSHSWRRLLRLWTTVSMTRRYFSAASRQGHRHTQRIGHLPRY